MILIIKSTHSLSTILTDRSSGWWATQWVTIQSISILTHSLSEWSEHNSYTVMTMNTIDSKEKDSWWNTLLILQINSLNHYSQHSEVISILHPSLFHLSHSSIPYSLVMKNRLLFVSIHTNLCPTNSLHCYHLYDCEISPYCFIIHSSIHTHGYKAVYDNDSVTQRSVTDLHSSTTTYSHWLLEQSILRGYLWNQRYWFVHAIPIHDNYKSSKECSILMIMTLHPITTREWMNLVG